MSTTAEALSSVRAKSGRTARARSTNRRIASNRSSSSSSGRRRRRVGEVHGRNGESLLPADVQGLAAGGDHTDGGGGGEDLDDARPDIGDLLQVVEQQEDVLIAASGA